MGKFSLGGLVKCCFTDKLELFLTPTVPNDYTVNKCFTQLFQLNRDIYLHLVICVFFLKFYPYSLKIVQKSQQSIHITSIFVEQLSQVVTHDIALYVLTVYIQLGGEFKFKICSDFLIIIAMQVFLPVRS